MIKKVVVHMMLITNVTYMVRGIMEDIIKEEELDYFVDS
ncbi:hypothetical protein T190130A13A_40286 [Tenacibaculum sp. 190130A14a]|uniref:Uncharacterized protein n=1 Tax=Tenacibaculum polynesiense TaxID=3137857 RepID=A0ABM9PDS9_9FLAO